jgi:toxin ParE1/3/4
MEVRFTLEALAHISEIYAYIAVRSPAAASRILGRIFAEADRLGEFPQLGHIGVVPGTHEWTVSGLPYIIVHQADDRHNQLIILAVYHGAQER